MVTPRRSELLKLASFILASFVVGYNLHHIIHECGHVLIGLCCGGKASGIRSHPFGISYAMVTAPACPQLVTWGGMLFSNATALVASMLCFARRSALLFPILLWASLAFLVNGIYYVVGVFLNFGDPADLESNGVSRLIILLAGLTSCVFGTGLAIVTAATLKLSRYTRFTAACLISIPIVLYLFMLLGYTLIWNRHELGLWGTFVGAGCMASLLLGWLVSLVGHRLEPRRLHEVSWRMVIVMSLLAVAVVTTQLTVLHA